MRLKKKNNNFLHNDFYNDPTDTLNIYNFIDNKYEKLILPEPEENNFHSNKSMQYLKIKSLISLQGC